MGFCRSFGLPCLIFLCTNDLIQSVSIDRSVVILVQTVFPFQDVERLIPCKVHCSYSVCLREDVLSNQILQCIFVCGEMLD